MYVRLLFICVSTLQVFFFNCKHFFDRECVFFLSKGAPVGFYVTAQFTLQTQGRT